MEEKKENSSDCTTCGRLLHPAFDPNVWINSKANLGLCASMMRCDDDEDDEEDQPISGFDWKLPVDEFTALLEDEVASLRLVSISSPERADQHALWIRK